MLSPPPSRSCRRLAVTPSFASPCQKESRHAHTHTSVTWLHEPTQPPEEPWTTIGRPSPSFPVRSRDCWTLLDVIRLHCCCWADNSLQKLKFRNTFCSKIDITANKIFYQKKSLVLIFTENPTTAFTRDVYFHHVLPHSVRASVALANWDGSGWIEHVGQGVGEAVTPHNTTWIDVMRDTSLTCSRVCVLSNLMPM